MADGKALNHRFWISGKEGIVRYKSRFACSGPISTYKIFSFDDNDKCRILHTIYDAPAAYLHSMAMTETYTILTIWQADRTNY